MKNKLIFFCLVVIFIIYLRTAGRTILPNGDSGELVSTAFFGGISHPPGYPLYNLIGHFFLKLPIFGEPAFRLNVLSAVFHVLTLFFVYRSALILTNRKVFLSIFAVLVLAFSFSFWLYSLVAEVFALNNLFFSILIYILLKIGVSRNKKIIKKFAFLWCFIFGLSMTNNHLIVLTFPSFIFLLWKKNNQFAIYPNAVGKIKIGLFLLAFFILGLFPYLYFFWAKNNINPVTWSYPKNLFDFVKYFFRLNYGQFLNYHDYGFVGLTILVSVSNLLLHLQSFMSDFWIISFFIFFIIIFLFITRKSIVSSIFIILLFSHLFLDIILKFPPTNFSYSVLERLFLSFNILYSLLLVYFLNSWVTRVRQVRYLFYLYLIFFVSAGFLCFVNFKKADQSRNRICRDFYEDIVSALPKNSFVIINGDIQTFCFNYYHYVLDLGKNDKNVYFSSNAFFPGTKAKYWTDRYNLNFQKIKSISDLIANYKNKKNIFAVGGEVNASKYYPIGLLHRMMFGKKKINIDKLYLDNEKWFKSSRVLQNNKSTKFMTLSSKSLRENYCYEYIDLVNFFIQFGDKQLAKKAFAHLLGLCSREDFSIRSFEQKFLKLQSEFSF